MWQRATGTPASENTGSAWDSLIEKVRPVQPETPEPDRPMSKDAVSEEWVINGLVKRGMPAHIATAFAWNMKDESGLRPGINEIEPLVKGSRGGFGLYQLTGPRRRQYEAFAKKRGVDPSDPDAQLDFMMNELKTTEKRAAKSIYGARTTGEAASAIVNKFLRPHETHRVRRSENYLKRDAGGYTPVSSPLPRIRSWNDIL
jgi:hypothetical protein